MRLPPKTGTVAKLQGNRRKPWVAKKWVGTKIDDEKKTARPVYVIVGTFAKKSDAIRALMKETASPEEKAKRVTLADVYNEWSSRKFAEIGKTMQNGYKNAWSYLARLHRMPISELTTSDYEFCVDRANAPRTVRHTIQILLNGIYSYAIAHDYTVKDVSKYTDFRGSVKSEIERKIFSPNEVEQLFTSDDVKDKMILTGLFTGMRPGEIVALKRSEVDLANKFFRIAGSKTENGLKRSIPIHPIIFPLIEAECLKSAFIDKPEVFLSDRNSKFSYDTYADRVNRLGHTPHDTRHSFVTYAKLSGMDQTALKRIVGHSSGRDITESVYMHLDDDFLRTEMNKYRIC